MDKVFIEGLEVEALIGIYDWERRIRQPLRFDLEMAFDNRRPAATDAIADTLDYKAVSKRLVAFVQESGFGLVETLAERCAALVLDEFGVEHVRLKLSKPGAVRGAIAVGVIIERSRADRASMPVDLPSARGRMEVAPGARDFDARVPAAATEPAPTVPASKDAPASADARSTRFAGSGGASNDESHRAADETPAESGTAADRVDPAPALEVRAAEDAGKDPHATNAAALRKPPVGVSFLRQPLGAAAPAGPKAAGPAAVPAAEAMPVAADLDDDVQAAVAMHAAGPSTDADVAAASARTVDTATTARIDTGASTPPAPAKPPAPDRATSAERTTPLPPVRTPPPRPRNPAAELGRATRPAYLSLGSNIDARNNLRSALMALRARFGEVIASPVYRMPAVGFDGPDFLNAAAIIDSDLDPFALVSWLQGIERAHGRMRNHVKNSSRTLDMDIVYFDNLVLDLPGRLQLPRPELRHAFVLKPLADIAPGFVDPVRGVSLGELWAAHPEHGTPFETVSV